MNVHLSKSNKKSLVSKFSLLVFTCAALWCTYGPNLAAQTAQPAASQPPVQTPVTQSQSSNRKAKLNTPPEYPELARKLNIEGTARVVAVVSADGNVSKVKELGGNPILLGALVQAVKNWKYEPADHESMVEVRFEFVQQH
jgi:TonB family protein